VQIVRETVTVISIQSVFRTNPDITGLILTDSRYLIARQLIRCIEMLRLSRSGKKGEIKKE
jgi:hypothetical protein